MDQTRKEYVKELEAKAATYEKKFRHVVAAYKSLQSEKSALEVTLKSLSDASTPVASTKATASANKVPSSNQKTEFNDPLNVQTTSTEPNAEQLKETVTTLTKALSTVTGEKSHMEASYIADRRKLNQEKEQLEKRLLEEQTKNNTNEKSLKEQNQKLKLQLRTQQYEHEKEQNNHQIMMREFQKRITDERISKEQLETKLEELQVSNLSNDIQMKNEQDAKSIADLKTTLSKMTLKLQIAEDAAKASSLQVLQLRQDLKEIKEQHRINMQKEQERANEIERQLNNMAKSGENRTVELEVKLAELSETVGTYDRQHQQDQVTIQRMKERISQLDMENSALAQAATCVSKTTFNLEKEMDDSNLDVEALIDKITKLNELLQEAKKKSDHAEYLDRLENSMLCDNNHYQCQLKLQQLKDEFEQYKGKVQTTLKNKRKGTNKEVEELKNQVKELKDKIKSLKSEMTDSEQNYMSTVTLLRSSLADVKSIHKQELTAVENEWKGKLLNLEQQLQKQRQRSLSLLEEKDSEIICLKSRTSDAFFPPKRSFDSASRVPDTETTEEMISELAGLSLTDKKEHFLHYWQEISRRDVEISNLRRSKHQLEGTVREMQLNFLSKEECFVNEIEELTNQVHHLERNTSREGANLEYLKNVVLSYMLSSSAGSRQHMLNAIAAVLKFTSRELESVKLYNSRWW